MFRRLLSLIVFTGLLLLALGHASTSNLLAQTRGCPTTVPRTLTPQAEDLEGRTPAEQLRAHLADGGASAPGIRYSPRPWSMRHSSSCSTRRIGRSSRVSARAHAARDAPGPGPSRTSGRRRKQVEARRACRWDTNVEVGGDLGRAAQDAGSAPRLETLEAKNAVLAQVVEMHYFGGMTAEEVAVAVRRWVHVVRHELRYARAWLRRTVAG